MLKIEANLKNKNYKTSDSMKTYITDKISTLEKYFDSLSEDREPEFKVKIKEIREDGKKLFKVTISVHSPFVSSRAEANDLHFYHAFEKAYNRLNRQIRKHKEKTYKKQRKSIAEIADSLEKQKKILEDTKFKEIDVKPMTLEEAILHMTTMDYNFYMFLDAESQLYHTVYKRSQGGYGVLVGIEN